MSHPDESRGLRILSFDGGGIRGLSSLLILERILYRIQAEEGLTQLPLPCEYFDLIGGTSTGGLIAIMLGRLRMPVGDAIGAYDELAQNVFSETKFFFQDGKFKASRLEAAIKKIVGEKSKDANEPMMDSLVTACRTFVCAQSVHTRGANIPVMFRTYATRDEPAAECTIWEAARATSAAPTSFKRIEIGRGRSAQGFIDGGMGRNNPTDTLLKEANLVFGNHRLACVLSIGTGQVKETDLPRPSVFQRVIPTTLIKVMVEIATECEATHEAMVESFAGMPGVYFRFNVEQGMQSIKLGEWERLSAVTAHTENYMKREGVKQRLGFITPCFLRAAVLHQRHRSTPPPILTLLRLTPWRRPFVPRPPTLRRIRLFVKLLHPFSSSASRAPSWPHPPSGTILLHPLTYQHLTSTMSSTPPKHGPDLGVRVLSLGKASLAKGQSLTRDAISDGGGAGALSELLMLEKMMYRTKVEGHLDTIPSPCECFELIGGTGTGGVIALMLGRLRMSTAAAISAYQILSPQSKMGSTEQFQTSKFEEALKKIFQQEKMDDLSPNVCKTFVCAMNESNMNAGIPYLFRSYNTLEEPASSCMIWQAARATSATPGLFKPMEIVLAGLKQRYIDGCVGNNNPTSLVVEEAKQLYPSDPIVLVASLGTGHPDTIQIPKSRSLNNIAQVMKNIAADCEKTHEDNVRRFRSTVNTYFRFNVQQGMQVLEPKDWNKLPEVSAHTDSYLRTSDAKLKLTEVVKIILSKSDFICVRSLNQ
ncbi:acyl transferase/acyl hydrolase/lysophospholipase [Mycena leptocephala]|nr:acyl transferase/acyl hydrolase/lysophospholipase [Mycena leptocephala]